MPQDSPSRRLIFVCHPASAADELPCATKILSRLARRAYRRAAPATTCRRCSVSTSAARAAGEFRRRDSRRAGARSGESRFPVPHRGRSRGRGARQRSIAFPMSSWLRACRSFLWSSIPDDTLLDLAIRGKLHEPAVLEQQVSRMFADPRARAVAGPKFLRGLAADAQRMAAESGGHEVSVVRRQPAFRVRHGDRNVPRRAVERGPQHRRSVDVERDFSQRATGAPLRNSRRLRQPFPAREAHR